MADLRDLTGRAVSGAQEAGATASECFGIDFRTRSIYIEDDRPKLADEKSELGLGLKVAVGTRVGFSSSTAATPADVTRLVEDALGLARASPEDPHFVGFPEPAGQAPPVEGTTDPAIGEVGPEALAERGLGIARAVSDAEGCEVPKGLLRAQRYETVLANSGGLEVADAGTLAFLAFTCKYETATTKGEGIVKRYSRNLDGLRLEEVPDLLVSRARRTAGAKAYAETLEGVAVLAAPEIGNLLLSTVARALDGEMVRKGRSAWTGKLGERVAAEGVSLRDEPRRPGGLMSGPHDDEGSAAKDQTLVEDGVLRRFVYNDYNARIETAAAGNGYRRGVATVEAAYATQALPSVSNLVLPPSGSGLDDLIADIPHGVYVEKFAAPEADAISGAFGLEVRNATLIEGGELTTPVKQAVLAGNLYDGMKRIVAVADDVAATGPMLAGSLGAAYTPAVAFEGFRLVGQQ